MPNTTGPSALRAERKPPPKARLEVTPGCVCFDAMGDACSSAWRSNASSCARIEGAEMGKGPA